MEPAELRPARGADHGSCARFPAQLGTQGPPLPPERRERELAPARDSALSGVGTEPGSASTAIAVACVGLVLAAACRSTTPPQHKPFPVESLRGMLFTPPQVLAGAQREAFGLEWNAIVLAIDEKSSFRAVASAVERVRERDLAVGYWIDSSADAASTAGLDGRIASVRELLRDRPAPDAIFLSGLEGPPADCGCGQFECCSASAKPRVDEAARFVAAVRNFSAGALVVPVWLDGCAPGVHECKSRKCGDPACAQHASRAWTAVVADSPRVALILAPRGSEASTVARLRAWQPPARTALIAVLDAASFHADELRKAVAAAKLVHRTGLLLDYR